MNRIPTQGSSTGLGPTAGSLGCVVPSRVLGAIRGGRPGPLLLIVAGIHGNEPAGVRALQRVLPQLHALAARMSGDVVALAGNVRALAAGRRFLHEDLNRRWSPTEVAQVRRGAPAPSAPAEAHERAELLAELDAATAAARGATFFLDLHTTSADGIPFSMVSRAADPRAFALGFRLPVIVGLLELLPGVLLEYMRHAGCTCLGIEAGGNAAPESVANHEAVVWAACAQAGLVAPAETPALAGALTRLEAARGGLPPLLSVEGRHPVTPADQFRMEPGFANIARVGRGQLLARDRNGEIRAEHDGLLLMPLYQPQGDDGFFLARELAI